VREYLLPPDSEAGSREADAAEELIGIIHSYLNVDVRVTACGLQNAIQATKSALLNRRALKLALPLSRSRSTPGSGAGRSLRALLQSARMRA
jgi:hypothetical protein